MKPTRPTSRQSSVPVTRYTEVGEGVLTYTEINPLGAPSFMNFFTKSKVIAFNAKGHKLTEHLFLERCLQPFEH